MVEREAETLMPSLSQSSLEQLHTCHPVLQALISEVAKNFDIKVTCGHRNKIDQDKAFLEGKSKLQWPNGPHNKVPSTAVDIAPYPIDWSDETKAIGRFYYLAGYVRGVAERMGIRVRVGADWDGDFDIRDQSFNDLPHIELLDV